MTERVFPAADSALDDAIAFVEGALEKADCPMKVVMQITVSVEELFVNIAHYAYDGKDGTVLLALDVKPGRMELCFKDSGKPFDPLSMPEPDITLSAEERDIGGLGIFMVRKTMDSVSYRYTEGQNQLTIVKTF